METKEGRIEIYGRCEEWFIIELTVFLTFMGTMIILMIKSRFTNIGFDNSLSFDPKYMSRMANFICQNFEWDFSNLVGPETKIEEHEEQDHVLINGLKLPDLAYVRDCHRLSYLIAVLIRCFEIVSVLRGSMTALIVLNRYI